MAALQTTDGLQLVLALQDGRLLDNGPTNLGYPAHSAGRSSWTWQVVQNLGI